MADYIKIDEFTFNPAVFIGKYKPGTHLKGRDFFMTELGTSAVFLCRQNRILWCLCNRQHQFLKIIINNFVYLTKSKSIRSTAKFGQNEFNTYRVIPEKVPFKKYIEAQSLLVENPGLIGFDIISLSRTEYVIENIKEFLKRYTRRK